MNARQSVLDLARKEAERLVHGGTSVSEASSKKRKIGHLEQLEDNDDLGVSSQRVQRRSARVGLDTPEPQRIPDPVENSQAEEYSSGLFFLIHRPMI